jgi:hypothetical protein
MAEKNTKSAFSTIMDRLDDLTESQLHQVYLVIGVRLGVSPGATSQQVQPAAPGSKNQGKGKATATKGGIAKPTSAKGNPSRKSQWANHPLYKEYHELKKLVETEAKEARTSFAAVSSPNKTAYDLAFTRWMEAKSSFRDRKTATEKDSAEDAEEAAEAADVSPETTGESSTSSSAQPKAGTSRKVKGG